MNVLAPPSRSAITSAIALALALAACNRNRESRSDPPHVNMQAGTEPPLKLFVSTRVYGIHAGPFADGARLTLGDSIFVTASASKNAYFYLLGCNSKRQLELLGSEDAWRYTPSAFKRYLRLDGQPGLEAFYVIASHEPLEQDDPQLSEALKRARTGGDCEPPPLLSVGVSKKRPPDGNKTPPATTVVRDERHPSVAAVDAREKPSPTTKTSRHDPTTHLMRGENAGMLSSDMAVAGSGEDEIDILPSSIKEVDGSGEYEIAVLRYSFEHHSPATQR